MEPGKNMVFAWQHCYRGAQCSFDEIFDRRGYRQGQKEMKWPATAMKKPAALSSKRPALALQEPAPDHAATATHELQAEEELPFFLLEVFFLVSIAAHPACGIRARAPLAGALAARPTCLVPKV